MSDQVGEKCSLASSMGVKCLRAKLKEENHKKSEGR